MDNLDKETTYLNAKRRVEKLKGFYFHLIIYFGVNSFITVFKIIRNIQRGETFEEAFFDFSTGASWLLWGLGLIMHAFVVFILPKIVGNNWEDRKIKQFMEEEKNNKF